MPQPAVLPDDLGDDERFVCVGVADDVDRVQPGIAQNTVQQARRTENLLEEGDDDDPGQEVRQVDHGLHEAAQQVRGEAVQQQGDGQRYGEEEDQLEQGDRQGVPGGVPEVRVTEHPVEVLDADPGAGPQSVERHVLLERHRVADEGAVVEEQEVRQPREHQQHEGPTRLETLPPLNL